MAGYPTISIIEALFSISLGSNEQGSNNYESIAPVKPISITLIDDDADDRLLFNDVFKGLEKVNAVSYKNAEDFLDSRKWGTSNPDVILLDLNMPGMNGFECLHAIKAQDGYNKTKIYVYSTSDDEEYVNKAYELGAVAYIRKPYSYHGLHKMAKYIINESVKGHGGNSYKNFLQHFE